MLTGESCLIRRYNHPYVMDILSSADAVECGLFLSGSKFESQVQTRRPLFISVNHACLGPDPASSGTSPGRS